MSIQVNTYFIIGYKFKYDAFIETYGEEEAHEFLEPIEDTPYEGIKNKNGLTALCDGMNGEYIVIGYAKEKTENHDHFHSIVDASVGKKTKEMVASFLNLFLKPADEFTYKDIKPYIVSHYR